MNAVGAGEAGDVGAIVYDHCCAKRARPAHDLFGDGQEFGARQRLCADLEETCASGQIGLGDCGRTEPQP
jgi:hypothetical protein